MMLVNMQWLHENKNKTEIKKLLSKREQIIIDITINGKNIANYQRNLKKITKNIEVLYYMGVAK